MLWWAIAIPWVRDLFASGRKAFAWAAVVLLLVQLFPFPQETLVFDFYRPELHYMRGPGPKCRERDNGSARP